MDSFYSFFFFFYFLLVDCLAAGLLDGDRTIRFVAMACVYVELVQPWLNGGVQEGKLYSHYHEQMLPAVSTLRDVIAHSGTVAELLEVAVGRILEWRAEMLKDVGDDDMKVRCAFSWRVG